MTRERGGPDVEIVFELAAPVADHLDENDPREVLRHAVAREALIAGLPRPGIAIGQLADRAAAGAWTARFSPAAA